ncbi:MAG: transcriptional repressor [Myxococcales bacterium]|nr:transcriptional repressor [Myxococcales bacterium]
MRLSRIIGARSGGATAQAVSRLREAERRRSLRSSRGREEIARAAAGLRGHFEVDALVRAVRARGGRASRATVYRTLPLLVEAGILEPAVASRRKGQYETAVGRSHHDHLVCAHCHEVVEFSFEAFEILQREVAARHGFELIGHLHELVGICRDCRQETLPHGDD